MLSLAERPDKSHSSHHFPVTQRFAGQTHKQGLVSPDPFESTARQLGEVRRGQGVSACNSMGLGHKPSKQARSEFVDTCAARDELGKGVSVHSLR